MNSTERVSTKNSKASAQHPWGVEPMLFICRPDGRSTDTYIGSIVQEPIFKRGLFKVLVYPPSHF